MSGKDENEWRYDAPPNETIVEAEEAGETIQVMAFYGRDGYRPHWKSADGTQVWCVDSFTRWREVAARG